MVSDHPSCMACSTTALLRLRVVPFTATRTLWDATPRDIFSCAAHVESARKIGTVISATPLGEGIATRMVAGRRWRSSWSRSR